MIKPGERSQIHVTVQTLGYRGPFKHSVKISTNDPLNPKVNLLVTANVEKELIAIPPYIILKEIPKEKEVVRKVKLKNVSEKTVLLKSIHAMNKFIEVAPNAVIIQPGGMAELTIRVLPDKTSQGILNSWIRIQTDIPYLPVVGILVRAFDRK